MYNVIENRTGKTLIRNELINEINPLLVKCIDSLNHQRDADDLLCWVVDIFDEDFEEQYGVYPQELLQKFALCVLNARHFLIEDKDQFCEDFNDEDLDLEIGFDKAFYPAEIGNWYDELEFIIMEDQE